MHATRSKRTRADPAASLYERGLVHHAGRFPDLEDQLCQYDGTGASPDRMDALVWALADLFPPNAPQPIRKCESSEFKLSCHPPAYAGDPVDAFANPRKHTLCVTWVARICGP